MPGTMPFWEEEREPTPSFSIEDKGAERWVLLQAGAHYLVDLASAEPLESRESVQAATGVSADLVAEVFLSPKYALLFFDRGHDKQGVEAPIIPGSVHAVSDRYFVTDEAFLMRANMRSGMKRDLRDLRGLVEMCVGASMPFGRGYDHDGRFDTERMPLEVSEKHAALSIDFAGKLHIIDAYSRNLTRVHMRRPRNN